MNKELLRGLIAEDFNKYLEYVRKEIEKEANTPDPPPKFIVSYQTYKKLETMSPEQIAEFQLKSMLRHYEAEQLKEAALCGYEVDFKNKTIKS